VLSGETKTPAWEWALGMMSTRCFSVNCMMLDPPWMLSRLNHGWRLMLASHCFPEFSAKVFVK